jgi:hypothetical protein
MKDIVALTLQSGQPVGVTNAPDHAPAALVSLGRALALGLVAGLMLVIGAIAIYTLGAGYFGHLAVPSPLNFVVAPTLLFGLALALWRFVIGRV